MSAYTLYDPKTGKIIRTVSNAKGIDLSDYPGLSAIEGDYPGNRYRIENGQAVLGPVGGRVESPQRKRSKALRAALNDLEDFLKAPDTSAQVRQLGRKLIKVIRLAK